DHRSDSVVVVSPCTQVGTSVRWAAEFKSPWIAEQILAKFQREGWQQGSDNPLQFSRPDQRMPLEAPSSKPLALGGVMGGVNRSQRLTKMSFEPEPPAFVVRSPGSPEASKPSASSESSQVLPPWPQVRTTMQFDMPHLPNTFTHDTYYTPDLAFYCPALFDALIISRGVRLTTAHLWLLRMTPTSGHVGASGYIMIRRIV
ncbi:hypothetical protein BD310DRAFT_781882, partial [Dichomitus squalens]